MAFPTSYKYRASLTIDYTKVSADLTDFPVLLNKDNLPANMLDSDLATAALNGGGDIRFSSDINGSTQLACEVVSFATNSNPASADIEVYVKIPTLSSSTNTVFYVWWGGPDTAQPAADNAYGSENVWDSSFIGVWHMQTGWTTTASAITDSTSNDKHGTGSFTVGTPTMESPAGLWGGKGIGSTDATTNTKVWQVAINGGAPYNTTARSKTFEGWVYWPNEASQGWWMGKGDNSGDEWDMRGLGRDSNKLWWNRSAGDGSVKATNDVSATNWNYYSYIVASDGALALYTNGAANGTWGGGTISTEAGTKTVYFGHGHGDIAAAVEPWRGRIDEFRISNTNRAAAWANATYATNSAPSTFVAEGTIVSLISEFKSIERGFLIGIERGIL
jgi:hypothetical protein